MTAFKDRSTRVALSSTVFGALVDTETMVMDIEQGKYVMLNDVATDIWQALSASPQGMTVGEILNELATHYEGDIDVIASDVALFLTEMNARGLILLI